MKNFKILAYSTFLLSFSVFGSSGEPTQEVREATVIYDITSSHEIAIKGRNTQIEIETWSKNQVEVYAIVEFKGEMINRVQTFLDSFEQTVKNKVRKTPLTLSIDMDLDRPNKVEIGTKTFGTQIGYGVEELKISYRLKVPAGNDINIYNSYEELSLRGDFTGEVRIEHYSGDLEAGSFQFLELNLKYGSAAIISAEKASFTLYEQDLEMKRIGEGDISTKYSKIQIENAHKLDFDSYESKIIIKQATSLTGKLKYGQLEILESADMIDFDNIYEIDVEGGQIELIRLFESKYCDFKIQEVGRLEQQESYEDKVKINILNELESEAKYSKYSIQELRSELDLNGYECEVEIEAITSTVSSVSMGRKYGKLDLDLNGRPFHLDVRIQYGDVDYPDNMERKIYIKDGSKIEMEMSSKNAGNDALKVVLRGYEMDARID